MRLLLVLLLMPFAAGAAAPSDDGFIWIDANTRIKVTPTSASAGASAPEKAPEQPKKPKKEQRKK